MNQIFNIANSSNRRDLVIIRLTKAGHILAATGRHTFCRTITMRMAQAYNCNIRYIPATIVNVYSHTEGGIEVNQGENYGY